jgi:Uri superfamily endonuclease
MMAPLDPNSGLYVVVLQIQARLCVDVGALGPLQFDAGTCLYVGSARRNLRQRVARHLAATKRVRWHVDYLTTNPGVRVVGAVVVTGASLSECVLNQSLGASLDGAVPVPRFGNSDCRAHCPAHLWWHGGLVSLEDVAALVPAAQLVVGTARTTG